MKPTIVKQLYVIWFLEQQKLLNQFNLLLKSDKKNNKIKVPYDLIKHLTILQSNFHPEVNFEISASNQTKHRKLLSMVVKKIKNLGVNLKTIEENLASQNEILNNIRSISDNFNEFNQNLKYNLPENPDIKTLAPFIFLDKDAETKEGSFSIIVVNENGADHLKNLLDSFLRFNTCKNFKFIVVDQYSTDNSLDMIKSYQEKLPVEIIYPGSKSTFAYLNNLAADASRSEFLLFINNKVVLESDVLVQLVELFRTEPSCGIAGASIEGINPANNVDSQNFYGSVKFKIYETRGLPDIPFPLYDPAFLQSIAIKTSVKDYRGVNRVFVPQGIYFSCLKPYPEAHAAMTGIEKVPGLYGSFIFCRRDDFIKADGFDLNYFNGYDAMDLCLKFANKLFKKSFLAHDVHVKLNAENFDSEFEPDDETVAHYNLGILLNRHGYYLKYKYLESLVNHDHYMTEDTNENLLASVRLLTKLGLGLNADNKAKEKIVREKILEDYLTGSKNKKLRIAIKIPAFDDEKAQFWGDYHFAHSLKNAFIKMGHPARVDLYESWYEQGYLTDDVVIVLRGIAKYHTRASQINIMWNISHPEKIDRGEYHDYDHVFVASNVFAHELNEKFGIKAEKLLQCTDSGLFFPDPSPAKEDEKTDILFVGNSRGAMRKSIEFSMQQEIPVTIYGTNWEKFLPSGMIKGNYIKNEELRKYYANCNILLNDHWDDMIETGYISNRIFDAMACGAIVLTDRVNGIKQTFSKGLYFYSNAEEFAEQVKWIKAHFLEAKQLAMESSEEVLKNHTFDHRAERIIEVALQIHHQKTSRATVETAKKPGILGRWFGFSSKTPENNP